ncbi:hypothetical protein KDL29_11595 [bacterium]|nr:hypothetical protein [bacterium]
MVGRNLLMMCSGALLAGSLLATAAHADDDFSLRLRFDSGERGYVNGQVYSYGLYGTPYYYNYGYNYGYQPGLSLSYRDGDLRADYGNRLYNGRHRNRHNDYYNDFSYGYGETSDHPNDRGGYRVFIPRGLESGSERVLPDSQYLGLPQVSYGGHRGGCYDGCGCGYSSPYYNNRYYSGGYPLVIQYGYPVMGLGYQNPYQQQVTGQLYTAPDYPELGYFRDRQNDRRYDDTPDTVVNDNSVTNNYYYYGNSGASGASLPQPPREAQQQPAPPQEQAAPAAPVESYATRFRTETRLELSDGSVTHIALNEEGRLSVGPENGPGQTVSAAAERDFGCFATFHSQHGLTLVFREGDTIMGAYQDGSSWWSEALSADVDFDFEVSISTMNGEPWLKFTTLNGQRVIMKFADGVWQTVGYGTVGNK